MFKGGVHPPEGKELSNKCEIKEAPLLDKYTVILQQHIGAPPKPIVVKGDEVKKGQLLAESGGFVSAPIHSPTSGTVSAMTEIPGPMGAKMAAIEITADGKDDFESPFPPIEDWKAIDPDELKKRVAEAGIVGMGGAAFPTAVKLSPPADKKIDCLIINAAECEPFLTADHRTMLERTDAVLEGTAILAKILGVDKIVVGVEGNKPDAIETMSAKAGQYDIKVLEMRVRYPQGAEKQLIYAVSGRKVPTGGLPMDVGCVVQNVGTAVAVQEAVVEGKPLFERVTTVTGEPVVNPGNWKFRIGTPLSKVLELAGGIKHQPGKVILGGPMMGFAQKNLDVTIMKNASGVLLLSKEEITQFESDPCIRCGKCVDACPMNLLPGTLSAAAENERFDIAEDYRVMDCIECGSCSYVCPAHRPLVQHFKRSKAEITAKRRKQ
ncbi:MAG: electron transport complex subunit RsxC [Kiritimatiellaeota bacterium]|nr:electron transport complex subunit RsxC [Kiritimatiellota bacterium]